MFDEHTYSVPHWGLNPELETEVYLQQGIYDALNRPVSQQTGRIGTAMSSVDYTYNEAGLLETVKANAGQKGLKDYVKRVDYNEKGQRKAIAYGNNSKTVYSYDRDTFRLSQLRTLNPEGKVQDLNYTYDPVGNISTIINLAEDTIFFNNQKVEPSNSYGYDALYRLTFATGREHIGQSGVHANAPDGQTDIFRINLPHPGDGGALQNYGQSYSYDPTGNMQMMRHIAGLGNLTHRWTKTFSYNNNDHDRQQLGIAIAIKKNNQLLAYRQGSNIQNYGFDVHGNMHEIQPNEANGQFDLSWNCFDQLKYIDIPSGTVHYWYDASGERSRKVVTDGTNITKERVYFGSLEVYREYNGNSTIKLERESLHVQNDTGRIALVDTKTIDHPTDDTQEQLLRYQYGNHLGSSSLELDATGTIISYEEYYPYGTTSYQAVSQTIKAAAKRYRYTGMERDEESGLNYHSARYYLPWLGRWLSADPIGIEGGINLYLYADNNSLNNTDSSGLQPEVSGSFTNTNATELEKDLRSSFNYSENGDFSLGVTTNKPLGPLSNFSLKLKNFSLKTSKEGGTLNFDFSSSVNLQNLFVWASDVDATIEGKLRLKYYADENSKSLKTTYSASVRPSILLYSSWSDSPIGRLTSPIALSTQGSLTLQLDSTGLSFKEQRGSIPWSHNRRLIQKLFSWDESSTEGFIDISSLNSVSLSQGENRFSSENTVRLRVTDTKSFRSGILGRYDSINSLKQHPTLGTFRSDRPLKKDFDLTSAYGLGFEYRRGKRGENKFYQFSASAVAGIGTKNNLPSLDTFRVSLVLGLSIYSEDRFDKSVKKRFGN